MSSRSVDVGEVCPECQARVRLDSDGCLGCACDYEEEEDDTAEDEGECLFCIASAGTCGFCGGSGSQLGDIP